ncbi:MAG: purine-nucleoside phosphorylase [Candidatus Gastranaerophilales bacterium]|nr:purine-nucleoside phosphorylase [Candidatus Gastranaerophilales bacterium]
MLLQAANFIEEKINNKYIPEIALILGSGLGALADEINDPIKIKYHEIPAFKQSSITGHVGQLVVGKLQGKDVMIMQGRIHLYEGHDIKDIVFPIKVMKLLGIKKLIITNAAGSLNENFEVGSLMLIKDHINFMGTNPLIGRNDEELGVRFPDMSEIYDKELLVHAKKCADKLKIKVEEGVYVADSGPSFETPAEVKMMRILGGDAIGMSTVPEAIVANYCNIKVLGISCLANYASGITDTKLSHQEVMEAGEKVKDTFSKLIKEIVKDL